MGAIVLGERALLVRACDDINGLVGASVHNESARPVHGAVNNGEISAHFNHRLFLRWFFFDFFFLDRVYNQCFLHIPILSLLLLQNCLHHFRNLYFVETLAELVRIQYILR